MSARLALAADLGYQLQLATLASRHAARQELAELHLTPARVTALIHIRDQPGCDQTELGNRLLVNRAAGMKIANTLAEQGLIERLAGRDRRSKGLYLTPLGERTLGTAQGCLARAVARTCTGLQASEQQTLLRLLCKLNASATLERANVPDAALAEEL
ncbi:MarR family winged helix-turn-helix transcriptional regulator [Xanthomonas arboricola pv. juglandis]|uniref:Winged helix-turn-helix transcriptional regulator n=1 Tax=Xanthomonas campestris pv. juglandis TaxID=195709 RepID=A0A2N7V7N5_XANCJ|nr:MarR family winged helix-turn-helix transcriptional regulator [Xanthomonas arboricola]AKU52268.1 MarR family transcriptional regulator [Xanthomonas arboricola pv. juglandis]KOA97327.1 MarR family transcriptional regulator [Xanthomonas arboricola]KOB03973.1 MarR family transcriptional regulator [Xanthomonas arboricola]KOB05719.1 MarR family transcriptional regulator [Xanthomonas arboricola]KOB11751.1 MarR family transcriptional regulator [Xanthomonas arboricola]